MVSLPKNFACFCFPLCLHTEPFSLNTSRCHSSCSARRSPDTAVPPLAGMSLISMCIQMMQDQIVTKVRWAAEESGLVDSEARQQQRVRARRSRAGAVPETKEQQYGYRQLGDENRRRRKQRKDKAEQEEQQKEKEEQKEKSEEESGAERRAETEQKGRETNAEGDGAASRKPDDIGNDEDMLFNMA